MMHPAEFPKEPPCISDDVKPRVYAWVRDTLHDDELMGSLLFKVVVIAACAGFLRGLWMLLWPLAAALRTGC
jgi:hypothetical protein